MAGGPDVPGSHRVAARVVLLDAAGAVLLFEGRDLTDPGGERWWFTPGGAVEAHESPADAAVREVAEETGHRLDGVVGPVTRRETSFRSHGVPVRQVEHWFAARVGTLRVSDERWTGLERESVTDGVDGRPPVR